MQSLARVAQPITLAVGLQDVHTVRQAVQQRAGQAFAAKDLCPYQKLRPR